VRRVTPGVIAKVPYGGSVQRRRAGKGAGSLRARGCATTRIRTANRQYPAGQAPRRGDCERRSCMTNFGKTCDAIRSRFLVDDGGRCKIFRSNDARLPASRAA
ncbi:hypothetical protein, partial [Pantoea agglomerans]|uniref:hypothetical protein n=1 Tax=Enterobacter agglomerans TaxID=549 RepID=UPI001CA3D345